ncbi:MAG: histidine phosphatase family protein [Oscillospiraceae bacterium]|nr:histidine phosphatase family protein [Oscillospiraceae bacterium]
MKLYILRHGETALNSKGVMQGWLDEPLNENGRRLAVLSGQAMKGIRFDRCISSPLIRATQTAEIILRESENAVKIEIDDRIREINFGDLEGKSLSEMGKEGYLFYTDPLRFAGFPNGESIRDVCERTQAFLKELIAKDDGKVCLISTHGCAMRAMVNCLKDDPSDYWYGHAPYNCSFTIVETETGTPRITAVDKVYYDSSLIVDHFRQKD